MAEYIERTSAIGKLQSKGKELSNGYYTHLQYGGQKDVSEEAAIDTYYASAEIVAEIPTSDVVEVRHGEWVQTYGSRVSCSCCDPNREDDNPAFYKFMKFCPNCGAKMDGKDGAYND